MFLTGFEAPVFPFGSGLRLDLDLDACGKLDAHKSLYSLLLGVKDVDQSLVSAHFELLTAVLVLVNRSEDRYDLLVGRKRNRTADLASVSLCYFNYLLRCGVDNSGIIALESHSDFSLCHLLCPPLRICLNRFKKGERFYTVPGVSNRPLQNQFR